MVLSRFFLRFSIPTGYWIGKSDKHLRHIHTPALGIELVSLFSSSKHQQVSLPALISHWAGSLHCGHWWVELIPLRLFITDSLSLSDKPFQPIISSMVLKQPLHMPPLFLQAARQGVFIYLTLDFFGLKYNTLVSVLRENSLKIDSEK